MRLLVQDYTQYYVSICDLVLENSPYVQIKFDHTLDFQLSKLYGLAMKLHYWYSKPWAI